MVDFSRLSSLLQFPGEPEAGQEAKSDGGDPSPRQGGTGTGRNGVLVSWCGWLMPHSQAPVMKAADLGARFWLYEQEAGTAKCSP